MSRAHACAVPSLPTLASASLASVLLGAGSLESPISYEALVEFARVLQPGGGVTIAGLAPSKELANQAVLAGLVLGPASGNEGQSVRLVKPNWEIGASARIVRTSKLASGWAAGGAAPGDDELVSEADLLDAPGALSAAVAPSVCASTGLRKACADCSCGLAQALAAEDKAAALASGKVNSSCGSCAKGDAFRCATCPYRGLPPFVEGQTISLAGLGMDADDL